MSLSRNNILIFLLLVLSYHVSAAPLPDLRVAVLQSGTVNWELQHLKDSGYDQKNGFNLVITKVASLSAARLALTSNSSDMIVSDWLWAGKRNNQGDQLRFIPFSSQIGSIMVAPGTDYGSLQDLKGKNIGVAGGPSNKGWILLQAAARERGIDLQKESKVQFGSPPLLSQALKRGQVELLVTFWHYGARLESEGYKHWVSLDELMSGLGFKSKVPMLGYIYKNAFVKANKGLALNFKNAVTQAKQDLSLNDAAWVGLKPLMKAENNAIYKALISGYRNGTPEPIDQQQIQDAVKFFALIDSLNAYPSGKTLDPVLFTADE